jgi:aspartyl-tRNA(Asn)/glutamyl-tRNA(Gln) amidotransferase subunit A
MSVVELVRELKSGATAPGDLLRARLGAIRRHNRKLNAFITVLGKERTRARGSRLQGITIAVKDNVCVSDHRTTAGSRILRNFVPTFDADVIARLKEHGANIIGKTNMHEFAFGVTNVNPHYGDCKNPWSTDRVSGGSSGGSAVAVAQGMACAAVGTDTAGSVRIPASLCGVVGFKPTTGTLSTRGTVPLAWSFDTIGFLTRTVADAALLSQLTFGGGSLKGARRTNLKGISIGVPRNILSGVEDDVMRRYDEALAIMGEEGAKTIRFDLPHYSEALACRGLMTLAEAASYHRKYFQERYREYGPDLKKRLAQGMIIPAAVYIDAQRARRTLVEEYRSMFSRLDFIALPTTRISAPTIKASKVEETAQQIRKDLLAFTEPFNVYGAPAISIPCGMTRDRLPVGIELAGDINSDHRLLSVALALEEELPKLPQTTPLGS